MIVTLALTSVLAFRQSATTSADEALIETALKSTGLSYSKSSGGGSFGFSFSQKDRQNRTLYVNSNSNVVGMSKWYSIYTQVWSGKKPPSAAINEKVFTSIQKLGCFQLLSDGNGTHSINFMVQFDAAELPATPVADHQVVQRLKDMIYFVNAVGASMSDKIEKL
jgi:hypothetical protein